MVSIQRFDNRTKSTVPSDADIDRKYLRYRLRPGEALVLTDSDIDGEHVWVRGTLQDQEIAGAILWG